MQYQLTICCHQYFDLLKEEMLIYEKLIISHLSIIFLSFVFK